MSLFVEDAIQNGERVIMRDRKAVGVLADISKFVFVHIQ
jgi:hypothetical protein